MKSLTYSEFMLSAINLRMTSLIFSEFMLQLAEAVVKISLTMEVNDGKRRRTGSLEAGTSRDMDRRDDRYSRGGPSASSGHTARGRGQFRGRFGGYGGGRAAAGPRGGRRGHYY
jgi:hypothetical protein